MSDNEMILMPRKLTAENGGKYHLIGEFKVKENFTCGFCQGNGCSDCDHEGIVEHEITIPWTTIKKIYDDAVNLLGKELPLLAKKHTGCMISCAVLLGRLENEKRTPIRSDQRYMLGELHRHLSVMAERFYSGEIAVVDEFLQLWQLDDKRPK